MGERNIHDTKHVFELSRMKRVQLKPGRWASTFSTAA